MPYITQRQRDALDPLIARLEDQIADGDATERSGRLNYVICQLVMALFAGNYFWRSQGLSAVHEAECELRRRWLSPYEDQKAQENGDLFEAPEELPGNSDSGASRE